jgi:hypothetical protein
MKNLRLWFPVTAIAALMAAGCMLVSGQFIVTYSFADPLTITSPTTLAGVPVNLNEVGEYKDHKGDLKDVADLALVGNVTNLTGTATAIEVWMVASPGSLLTTDTAVRSAGAKVWGSLSVPASGTVKIDWDKSAALFTGRKALIDEIKGDGRFDLYMLGTGAYSFRVNKGALIAVISAGK